jgi:hypothetical protein
MVSEIDRIPSVQGRLGVGHISRTSIAIGYEELIERIAKKHSYCSVQLEADSIRCICLTVFRVITRGLSDYAIVPSIHSSGRLLAKPGTIHRWEPKPIFVNSRRDASSIRIFVHSYAID